MATLTFEQKTYSVDSESFLLDHEQWDEAFAEGLAPGLEIPRLTSEHWRVLYFIRDSFRCHGKCPLVYETCKANKLRLKELQRLFPTGYLRGACKLAGVTYKEACHGAVSVPRGAGKSEGPGFSRAAGMPETEEKVYRVDVRGFLVDPHEWDEPYALFKAYEMGMPEGLGDRHWEIIRFLRASFKENGVVPTVYQACETHKLDIEDLEKLFPHGYHRGAVKIAGLRVR
ncbi:MAG: hypothetical protein Kow0099_27560 [Candidatus Abyssubacteria bacterium]